MVDPIVFTPDGLPCLREAREKFLRIEHDLFCGGIIKTPEESFELGILVRGGVTVEDYEYALRALGKAENSPIQDVWSPWGYLKTVMLSHAATRRVALMNYSRIETGGA